MANPLFAYWFSSHEDLMSIANKIGEVYPCEGLEKHQQPNGEWVADAQGFMSLSRNFDSDRCVLQLAIAEPPEDVMESLRAGLLHDIQWGEIRPTDSGYTFMPMAH